MSIAKEFREFIARGNVVDLAVGVIIGGAFGKIVTSLVDGVVMPPIGLLLGQVDFAKLKYVLKAADPANKVDEVAITYGAFLNTVVQFLIIAFVIFLVVKGINSLRREQAAAPAPATPPAPTPTEALLAEIRDELKGQRPRPSAATASPAKTAPAPKTTAKPPARKPAPKR
jgi:large conductance mechanosensitive channel